MNVPNTRISRCIRLLSLLQSQTARNRVELARELEVSGRTILRDLRTLKEAGVSLHYDPRRAGYVLKPPVRSAASPLTDDELMTLLLAAQASLASAPAFGDLVLQASTKLLAWTEPARRDKAARVLKSLVVRSPLGLSPARAEALWREITQAICHERQVRIKYASSDDPALLRVVDTTVYGLEVDVNGWYVLARHSADKRTRRLDIKCIRGIETTSQ